MQHVTVLGFKKVLGTSITIPMEMLNAADLIRRINAKGYKKLTQQIVSLNGEKFSLTAGLEIVCDSQFHDIEDTDLIIIPALWGNPKGLVKNYPELIPWLQQQHKKGTLICAVGTGSYFLAEANLLDYKVATTHWYYFNQFEKIYPNVHLQRERFITKAGNIYCTGSVNSVRDVMLHFIEEYYGADVANQVSKHFTHEVRRSYASSFLKSSPQNFHDDEDIIKIQEWIQSYYHSEINLEVLTKKFNISLRSLSRRFKQATEKSPMQYIQQVRIDNAKELLKTSNLSISEVAYSVGYPDSSYFSSLFRKAISLSPKEYRHLVRKKLFKVDI